MRAVFTRVTEGAPMFSMMERMRSVIALAAEIEINLVLVRYNLQIVLIEFIFFSSPEIRVF